MKHLRAFCGLGVLVLFLASCSFPSSGANPTPTANVDAVATQVQQYLTAIPQQTLIPIQNTAAPAATQVLPTVTPTIANTPTPESSPTPIIVSSPTATVSNQPTATQNTADPKSTLGTATRADSLDTAKYWGLYSDEHVTVTEGAGYLSLTAKNPDGWHGWTLSFPKLNDFYLEVTATPGACGGSDSYGAMVRAPDDSNGYFFEISCDGRYRFDRWDGKNFNDLVSWKQSSAIKAGADQTNRLGIMAKGSQFTLYVNGTQVAQIEDSTYDSGVFGLSIASYKTPDFTVKVDEVDYWNLSS